MRVPLDTLDDFAREIASRTEPKESGAFVIALRGDLGAGKTTFVQALARAMGVERSVQSPTFTLMKKYPIERGGFSSIVHIDAYRLAHGGELGALHPEIFLNDPHAIVCLEWPERVADALPRVDLLLDFSSEGMGEGERDIEVRG